MNFLKLRITALQKEIVTKICLLVLLGLIMSFFTIKGVYASPDSELLYEEDFDDLTVGSTPHNFEWSVVSSNGFVNRSDCYFEVVNTIYNSTPNSLILNDTQGASSVYGMMYINVDLFSHQNGKVTVFFRVNTTANNPAVLIANSNGKITAQYYFKSDGTITYYDKPTWKTLINYSPDTWYNITTVFGSGGVDYWVNEIEEVTGCNFQDSYDVNQVVIAVTRPETGNLNIVYIDNIRIEGEKTTQDFYYQTSSYSYVCTDVYRVKFPRISASADKGEIIWLKVKTQYGTWVSLSSLANPKPFWSESWYPPAGGGTQVGLGFIAGGTVTVTNTSDTVEYYATVQDTYFNFTNTITFFKDYPYIAFKVYRKMNFSDPTTAQKQVDFLFSPLEIDKYYYTNATGIYSDDNDFSETYLTVKLSSPGTYFPFYGYYFKQNYTIATILTYPYDTSGMLTEVMNGWRAYGHAYSEWEISFGECASAGATPTYQDQIEEVSGVLAIYQGDEASTNSIKSLSQSLFSDWSSNRAYIARLADATYGLYITSTGTVKNHTFANNQLTVNVNASTGQSTVTKVYTANHTPIYILNTSFNLTRDFNSTSKLLTVNVTHSSAETITIGLKNSTSDPLQGNSVLSLDEAVELTSAPTYTSSTKQFNLTINGTGSNKNITLNISNITTNYFRIYDNDNLVLEWRSSSGVNKVDSSYNLIYNSTSKIATITIPIMSEHDIMLDGSSKSDGSSCSSNEECSGGYCVHNICRSSSSYCGDGYCDSGEICSSCLSDCGSCFSIKGGCILEDQLCYSNASCCSGLYCENNKCKSIALIPEEEEEKLECPICPDPTDWGDCIDSKQNRTNYRCSEETNYTCEEYTESSDCEILTLPQKEIPIYVLLLVIGIIISLIIIIVFIIIK